MGHAISTPHLARAADDSPAATPEEHKKPPCSSRNINTPANDSDRRVRAVLSPTTQAIAHSSSDMTSNAADAMPAPAATSPCEQLRKEILALAHPHRAATKLPPFSAGELIVMALVCKDSEDLQAPDILRWIVKHFKHYGNRALEEYTRRIDGGNRWREEVRVVVPGFNAALDHYELPVSRRCEFNHIPDYIYSIDTAAARLYLRGYLAKKATGTFPFLRLPAELRNHIYELTFCFAKGRGIFVDNVKTGGLSMLAQHPGDDSYAKDWWNYSYETGNQTCVIGRRDVRHLPPTKDILALLLVCKQISGEALPYFYQLNPLHINTLKKLTAVAHRMAPSRLEHLNHLSIELMGDHRYHDDVASFSRFPQTVEALKAIKDLKMLEIETTDKMWLSMRPASRQSLGRKTPFKKFAQIPGMKELARLAESAVSFNLRGNSAPELQKYLDSEAQLIKTARDKQGEVQGTEQTKGKKRKATVESADGTAGGERRVRKIKKAPGSHEAGNDV
ncbi:hypothetical protein DOTSEDRAFT_30272 [Dothistroma septosporum NZE10]|uniref:Fork-head domain-containing protein n=1 Tax=Dothistroma septosporum (strain NZE10 / CBS 128990) TaxID=675120 RepID=N1Q2N6_DOTSN|nr:hypothetical protein DOTSEDRAFT_30272 [Dothistroma septosporum NZE10]